jgi:hypothetical protein
MEICSDCGAVPLTGETESHGESLAALNVSVPPPVLETLTDAGDGFVPIPCVASNERVD